MRAVVKESNGLEGAHFRCEKPLRGSNLRTSSFRPECGNACLRRISPVARRSREGPLTGPTAAPQPWSRERVLMVESRCGAVAVGWAYLFAAPHMRVIRSRGFVPSFSPFVSDPKSEPSVIRSGFRCSYQPHIRSPLIGGRTNIPLTGGQGLNRTRPIFRSVFQGQRAGRSSTWICWD